jgi:hypothetical protein
VTASEPGVALPLPATCGGRCRPRWKRPTVPYVLTSVLLPPAAFFALVGVAALVVADGWAARLGTLVITLAFVAAFTAPIVLAYRRVDDDRRLVVAGRRVPVTVHYGRLLSSAFPVLPRRRPVHLPADAFAQPLLLLVAGDGHMWIAQPDAVSTAYSRAPTFRANPWIVPMTARDQDGSTIVAPAPAGDRRQPLDRDAPQHHLVLEALRWMGQPEPHDPPEARTDFARNDPRTFGGPVPGELLVTSGGRYHGLVLHRPTDAPASVPVEKRFATIRYHYFGTDSGLCWGYYLTSLTPVDGAATPSAPPTG